MSGKQKQCAREFLAFADEGLAVEAMHTGRLQRPTRVDLIDAAIGYYYCIQFPTPKSDDEKNRNEEEKKRYDEVYKKLLARRAEEMKVIKDPKKKFPRIPPDNPPTVCTIPPGADECRLDKEK